MSQPAILLLSMSLDFGGAETHVVSLAKALKRKGLRVLVASNGGRLVPQLEAAAIRHYQVALHARKPLTLLGSIAVVKNIVQAENIDLMHAHARIPAWVAEQVSKSTGIPLVTTYHGLYDDHWLLRLFTVPGRQTIAVSEDVKEHLVSKLGVPAQQITVIHNGIDVEQFDVSDAVSNPQQITYISRLAGARGGVAIAVLQAAALLYDDFPDLKVVIVGEGDRLAEVRQVAAHLNQLFERQFCHVLGGRSDIPQLLAQAGVVVGVGRVALEAMASGRPVIIAGEYGTYGLLDAQTLPLAMQHNFSGRGARQQTVPETLAQELKAALSDPERAAAAARLAREEVRLRYSVDEKAQEVLTVYRQAVPGLWAEEEEVHDR